MYRYGKLIRKKYTIALGFVNWYVINQITDTTVRGFTTRKKAREHLSKIQKDI